MYKKIIDYVRQFDHRLVSPIWGGDRAFHFLCLGHLDIAQALGFKLERVSPYLTIVKEDQLTTEEELEVLIQKREFNISSVQQEVAFLKQMLRERLYNERYLCGGGAFGPLTVASGILGAERM